MLTNSAQATWNRQILLEFQRTQFFIGIGGSSRFYIFLGRFTDLILFGQIVRIKLMPLKIYSPLIWFQCSQNIVAKITIAVMGRQRLFSYYPYHHQYHYHRSQPSWNLARQHHRDSMHFKPGNSWIVFHCIPRP